MDSISSLISLIRAELKKCPFIQRARWYGSSRFDAASRDVDIAVLVPSKKGVISPHTYRRLRALRLRLSKETNLDIDLVPHSIDEWKDLRSPLYYPRYNPALSSGLDLKNKFEVKLVAGDKKLFSFSDLNVYVILDNRTICRRQLVRSMNGQESRIFVSKLFHAPANILNYWRLKNDKKFEIPISDLGETFRYFDSHFGTSYYTIYTNASKKKKKMSWEGYIKLMNWYEKLTYEILYTKKFE